MRHLRRNAGNIHQTWNNPWSFLWPGIKRTMFIAAVLLYFAGSYTDNLWPFFPVKEASVSFMGY